MTDTNDTLHIMTVKVVATVMTDTNVYLSVRLHNILNAIAPQVHERTLTPSAIWCYPYTPNG